MDTTPIQTRQKKVSFSARPILLGVPSSSSDVASMRRASDKPRSILRNRLVHAESINIDGSTHAVTDANTSINKHHSKVTLGERKRISGAPSREVRELHRYKGFRAYDPEPEGSKHEAKHYKDQVQSRKLHPRDEASLTRYYNHMHNYYSSLEEGDNPRKTRITKRFDKQNNRHKALMKEETLPPLSKPDAIRKEQTQLVTKIQRVNRPLSSRVAGVSRNVTLPATRCITSVRQSRRRMQDGMREDLNALKTRIEQRSWGR